MSMTTLEYDTLTNAFAACKTILTDLQPRLSELRELYDSGGGVKATLSQEEMDEIPALSGLTKTAVDDGMYALTAVLLPAIENGYTALAQMAARSRGFAPPVPVPMTPPPVPAP